MFSYGEFSFRRLRNNYSKRSVITTVRVSLKRFSSLTHQTARELGATSSLIILLEKRRRQNVYAKILRRRLCHSTSKPSSIVSFPCDLVCTNCYSRKRQHMEIRENKHESLKKNRSCRA
ncbi:hypothetical protein BDR07DRAFT_359841 [Suillus spraguei]|nr:hypothetical protein BDR07DRAFT_359841 [Suillus spraguei]